MSASRTTIGTAVVVASLGLTACGEEPSRESQPSVSQPSPASDTSYRDGEYSATGWYGSLPSHHDVTLSIEDNVVTAVEITTPAEDPTSLGYQERFAAALPDAVIGRSVSDLALDRLAGSSGCSEGFMDALTQIKQQALDGTE